MYRLLRLALAPLALLLMALLWMGCDSDNGVVGVDPDATSVEFTSGGGTAVPADSLATFNVRINNPSGSAVTVEVLFAQDASSATPEDIGGITVDDPISVTFPAGAQDGDTQSVELDVSQADITGGAKEARFALQRAQSDSPVRIGNNRGFDLSIGFPRLADIRGRIGGTFTFQAIVTSIRGSDTSIQDESGGIVVSRNSEFAGEVSRGDQVIITGTITDFDGLRQIDQPDNLDSFDIVSSGNDLPAPLQRTVPELDNEDDENMRVRVNNLQFTDGRDTFVGGGGAGNFSAEDENGNSITIRLESGSFYAGRPVPQGTFDFEGVFATFRGTGQLNAHDEGDLIFDADDVPDDDPDDDPDAPDVISIADAIDTEGSGESVRVVGLVTRIFGSTTVIEDETAGIVVSRRSDVADAAEIGDELEVTGSVGEFNGLFQLDQDNVEDFEILSSGNDLPEPIEIGLDEVGDFQSRLVAISGLEIINTDDLEFQAGGAEGSYDVTDGNVEITLRIESGSFYEGEPIPEGLFNFRGVTGERNGPRIFPLIEGDIEEEEEVAEVTIAEARDLEQGTPVVIEALVTRANRRVATIQEDGAGLLVFQNSGALRDAFSDGTISSGDIVRFTGEMGSFGGAIQLNGADDFEVVSSDNTLPDPVTLTLAEVNDQVSDLEWQLVEVSSLTVINTDDDTFGGASYDITDGDTNGILRIGDSEYFGEPIPEGSFTFVGPLGFFEDEGARLRPIELGDIIED